MPAAAAAAVGGIIVAKIASNANKHATDVGVKGTDDALAYQKEHDAMMLKREDDRRAAYQRYYEDYMNRYFGGPAPKPRPGVLPTPGGAPSFYRDPSQTGGGTPAPGAPAPGGVPAAATAPVGAPSGTAAQGAPTLADMGGWSDKPFDWKQYGVGA